jgi:hypothetical protein
MSEPRVSDTATLLRLLHGEGIEFIVVGMAAGVLQGVWRWVRSLAVAVGFVALGPLPCGRGWVGALGPLPCGRGSVCRPSHALDD